MGPVCADGSTVLEPGLLRCVEMFPLVLSSFFFPRKLRGRGSWTSKIFFRGQWICIGKYIRIRREHGCINKIYVYFNWCQLLRFFRFCFVEFIGTMAIPKETLDGYISELKWLFKVTLQHSGENKITWDVLLVLRINGLFHSYVSRL